MPDPVVIDGVTFNINDNSVGSGLTRDQIINMLENARTRPGFADMLNGLAGTANPEITINIDSLGVTSNGIFPVPGNEGSTRVIELVSSTMEVGEVYKTPDGSPAQIVADQVLVHEIAHVYDNKVRGTPITTDNIGEREKFATAKENEHLRELGLKPRERFYGPNAKEDFEEYQNNNPNPEHTPKPPSQTNGPVVIPDEIYKNPPPPNSDPQEAPIPDTVDDAGAACGAAENQSCPLILDLDHSGTIDLISLANSHGYFDRDLDGFAEATGLVNSVDGYLALDLNDNGRIDDNSELFGTATVGGFAVLAQYDSNNDGKISLEDTIWNDLLIWQDSNENGYSETSELYTLGDHDIVALNLAATQVSSTNQGHDVKFTGTFTVDTGSGTINYAMHDVWFKYDDVNTVYVGDFSANYDAAVLSFDLRGYGKLPSLYVGMCLDGEGTGNLLDLVTNFSQLTFSQVFDGTSAVSDAVKEILYRWADVDGVSPTSRGPHIDARKLEFLETIFDNLFLQGAHEPDPLYNASVDLNNAFDMLLNHFYARLVAQSGGGELLDGDWSYNSHTDTFSGIEGLNLTKLDELETEATGLANTTTRQTFWENVARVIEYTIGTTNLDAGDLAALQDAITGSDANLDLEDDILPALGSNAEPYNSGNDQTVLGSSGVDTLNGYAGNDHLVAYGDSDTLIGGIGADLLEGGHGNDTYVYADGDGEDIIEDLSGAETIVFGLGIDSSDLTLTRASNDDLMIEIDNGTNSGVIFVSGQFLSDRGVETILFNDTSTIDLTTRNWTLTGNSDNETLHGVRWGGGTVDTIYGAGGNDKIYGYDSNDTLYGGDGNDHIEGGDDNDTLYGDAGDDTLEGGGGNDHLYGGVGDDTVSGNAGDDTYYYGGAYGGGHDLYKETGGTDTIVLASGISSASTVYYRIGNDMQIVFDVNNTITIDSYYAAGGPKIETLDFYSDTDVTLSGVSAITQGDSGNNSLGGTNNTDYLYGNGGNDTLNGSNGNDFLYGGTGDDELNGGYGNDWLEGGAGNDSMNGGNDDDIYLFTSGSDTIYDLGGTDELRFISGWEASDLTFTRHFGAMNDVIITIDATNSITIINMVTNNKSIETLRFFDNSTLTMSNIQITAHGNSSANSMSGVLYSASQDDIMYGYGGADTLSGGAGNDLLYGGDDNDTLTGGDGDDILDGGAGNDDMTGGLGNDTFIYTAGLDIVTDTNGGTETLRMGVGIDVNAISFTNTGSDDTKITITASTDEVTVENLRNANANYKIELIEFADGFIASLPDYASWVNGTTGNDLIAYLSADDTIIAKAGNDTITAGAGNDDVHGGDGDDDISGQDGNDLLHGGAGDDILKGGDGLDTLYGGADEDIFVFEVASAFNNVDVIKDFSITDDAIDISDLLSGYDPMTDLLTDWVEMTTSGSDTILKVDRDGDGGTYSLAQIATIQGVTGLTDEAALVTNGNLIVV